MLDAFIIDRIRREREERDSVRLPLRIEIPPPPDEPPPDERDEPDRPRRGVVIIEDEDLLPSL